MATEYWRVLFAPSAVAWVSSDTGWLDVWLEFLNTRYCKSVNRDLWDQIFALYEHTMADGSLAWWDENGAWPSVIDDFVVYVKEEVRGGKTVDASASPSTDVEMREG